MNEKLRRELERVAIEVGAILNRVADDDERERLQEVFERRLNDELFVASTGRMADVEVLAPLAQVIQLRAHSVKA